MPPILQTKWNNSENAEEWMGMLRIAVAECNDKEIIHSLNDYSILRAIIHELTATKDTSVVISEQVLALTR